MTEGCQVCLLTLVIRVIRGGRRAAGKAVGACLTCPTETRGDELVRALSESTKIQI